jgi:glucosamine-6-phosphate isomerase
MQLTIYPDYDALSYAAALEIIEAVRTKPDSVLCFATGDTPKLCYEHLLKLAASGRTDFSKALFVGLDEWVGIPPHNEGSCHHFLVHRVFKPLGISPANILLFDGMSDDLANECKLMDAVIAKKGGIDLMLVGIGMNGHIGFNEPGVPANLYSHVVELDEITRAVGQKYFQQSTPLKNGITLGLRYFMEAKKVALLASGQKKADIIHNALEVDSDGAIPASIIRRHSNGLVLIDEDAASLLTQRNS